MRSELPSLGIVGVSGIGVVERASIRGMCRVMPGGMSGWVGVNLGVCAAWAGGGGVRGSWRVRGVVVVTGIDGWVIVSGVVSVLARRENA